MKDTMERTEWETGCPGLRVLHADNHLLVVRKPAGLLSQADHTGDPDVLTVCKAWVKAHYGKPGNVFLGLVHRLDRPVAGVMVLARTSKAASRLSQQIRERTVGKRYLAVVEGTPPAAMELRGVMSKDSARNVSQVVRDAAKGSKGSGGAEAERRLEEGKPAVLRFERLASAGGTSLLRVDLETGRAHQIRVQLSEAGWPIVGDRKYGSAGGRPAGAGGGPAADGPALYAESFTLRHPTRDELLTFRSVPEPHGPWARFAEVLKRSDS